MMTIEQLHTILTRAFKLPHKSGSDVFLTAAMMAEMIELSSAPEIAEEENKARIPKLTKNRIRDKGFNHGSVAACVHDLVNNRNMTVESCAAYLGTTSENIRKHLNNYKMRMRNASLQTPQKQG